MRRSSKHQAPSSRETSSFKLQTRPTPTEPLWRLTEVGPTAVDVWRLGLLWSLGLGIWSFVRVSARDFRAALRGAAISIFRLEAVERRS
jgi:hypothetical protein